MMLLCFALVHWPDVSAPSSLILLLERLSVVSVCVNELDEKYRKCPKKFESTISRWRRMGKRAKLFLLW